MPRVNVILNGFTGGEVSSEVWGRSNTDQWPMMVEQMQNMFPNPRGGCQRRAGLHYVVPTKHPTQNSRLIPFIFSTSQSYILELGEKYVRFFRDQGYVENIENVKSYIGDGSSTQYFYPYPGVAEADIEVWKNGTKLTEGGAADYTVAAVDLVGNQMDDFTVGASWDVNFAPAALAPWVLAANTAAAPVGSEPVLRQADILVARGSTIDLKFNIDSYLLHTWTINNQNSTNQLLSTVPVNASTATLTDDAKGLQIDFDARFSVKVGNQDTFIFELVISRVDEDDVVLYAENIVVDNTQAHDYVMPQYSIEGRDFRTDDIITAQFSVVTGGVTEAKILGATVPLHMDVVTTQDPEAKIHLQVINSSGVESDIPIEPVVGPWEIIDELIDNSYPLHLQFVTDPGLSITISDPSIINKVPGWVVTMNTAPAVADVVVIQDGSVIAAAVGVQRRVKPDGDSIIRSTLHAEAIVAADLPIFEIESPFTADQIDDIYFAQANDQLFICHFAHKPWRLTRYNAYDWRFEQPTFTGAPWEDGGYDAADGYPRVVAFFQERLYFASTFASPQTLWGSRTADFYEFALPADGAAYVPDDPLEYTIAAYTHEAIEWMSSERVLVVGTSATEHRIAPDQYVATDRPPQISRMSAYGGKHSMPAFMGNLTVFVQQTSTEVRTYEQTTQSIVEKWNSLDLTWMAKHLTFEGVKEISYALIPNSVLNVVTDLGHFRTMTYEPSMGDQAQVGWADHPTDGKFHTHATMPEGYGHQTWCVVEREIDDVDNPGETLKHKYVEFFDPFVYVDSSLTYPPESGFDVTGEPIPDPNYPPVNAVGGLGHLEGKTVTVRADGSSHPDRVVVNGAIDLNRTYARVQVGLRYTPLVKLMKFAQASEPANMQGMKGRWVEVFVRLVNSAYPLVDGVRPAERRPATPMDEGEPIITGDAKVYHIGFDRDKQLTITQDLPFPLYITSIHGVLEVDQGG